MDKEEVAYIGDDINDLDAIKYVGFGVTVADGTKVIKKHADYVTTLKGGECAVRELCEYIMENSCSRRVKESV